MYIFEVRCLPNSFFKVLSPGKILDTQKMLNVSVGLSQCKVVSSMMFVALLFIIVKI